MATPRPRTEGRSILLGEDKLHVRGVTYGTFSGPSSFPAPQRVRADFEAMAAVGANCVRTYVPPPIWLLDLAQEHDLHVIAGLAWEQHVAFLDDRERARRIVAEVGRQARACAGHPAVLCLAVGNEIPAAIVRWHGKRAVEGFIERLCGAAKEASPESLVTYVNYPSTEYLELPFLDLAAFNVFLEQEASFESYLARLQSLCGERPLLIAELGLDSRRNGERAQAATLEWQVRHAFGSGAAGVCVFSWTDEWHRGGHEVADWDFGLVDRERRPKPALAAVRKAFAQAPFSLAGPWPPVSVIVCTHNGARTLPQCLEHASRLDYPDFELIVVDDGSSDESAAIARLHDARVIATEHRGLSFARNAGVAAAGGEIVAFLDDDAYPDPDWLRYVAAALRSGGNSGVGGPNLPPADEGRVAECVAAAPGGPIHVLVSDREAEHLPGCNMAFRKSALEAVGGFDERFRAAGDDVDVCWRLRDRGLTLGFSPGAVVMHRRRDSVRRYLRQQYGYGKAEALLERKWPARYNRDGSSRWSGRIYDTLPAGARRRAPVRYGTWGEGLFQSLYAPPPGRLSGLLLSPELVPVLAALAALAALGLLWAPLLAALPPLLALLLASLWRAIGCGWRAHRPVPGRSRLETIGLRALTAALFVLQPAARAAGRLRNGLSPWRRRLRPGAAWPRPHLVSVWSESWRSPRAWVESLQDSLAARGGFPRSGGSFDRWDLELRAGPLGGVRIRLAVEEHGRGRQLTRARVWPRLSAGGAAATALVALLAVYALLEGLVAVGAVLAAVVALVAALAAEGTATATSLALSELARSGLPIAEASVAPEDPVAPLGAAARPAGAPVLPAPVGWPAPSRAQEQVVLGEALEPREAGSVSR